MLNVAPSDSILDEGDLGHALYSLPLPFLPSLRHLTLQGSLSSLRPPTIERLRMAFEIEEGRTYPAIQTISVRAWGPDRLHDWLAKIKEKLEKQGDWDWCFRHLLLQGNHRIASGVEDDVVERFPISRICEWISSSAVSLPVNSYLTKFTNIAP